MKTLRFILWLAVFGSLWGLNEVLAGEAFSRANVTLGSVWLAALIAFVLVPLGYDLGKKGETFVLSKPTWAYFFGFFSLVSYGL
ncbi:MAG: hypothetical protein OEY18_14020 [Candidatus Aminicenantes bacterium]|jgi:drug/metabolite transporter (DMT)-like permease|nr:hypothetical protein [Candidatus Aminicenantes bacterium]MDH5385814.1 hypothetical protein [Candidatus Aminicenantes bacterium]MDH5743879.1 hypothetical protein [Candidatus Aminicenantes bacterium]